MIARCAAVLPMVVALASAAANASPHLVGAQLYSCSVDGKNGGPGSFGAVYQYSTNSGTIHNSLAVNNDGSSIVFPIVEGDNVFTFNTGGIDPGDYGCLNLFFADAAVSFNPVYDPSTPIPGDLTVVAPVAGSGFSVPAQGTNVQSYNSTGASVIATSYDGARYRRITADLAYQVTAFAIDAQINGSFTVRLPEPGAFAAGFVATAGLAALARARARRDG